jgi:hypothetical protein
MSIYICTVFLKKPLEISWFLWESTKPFGIGFIGFLKIDRLNLKFLTLPIGRKPYQWWLSPKKRKMVVFQSNPMREGGRSPVLKSGEMALRERGDFGEVLASEETDVGRKMAKGGTEDF